MSPLGASVLVACGGAIGALGRYWLAVVMTGFLGAGLPVGTLIANVLGSFLIGAISIVAAGHYAAVAFWMVGVLGGFTTFSTFSLETVRMLQEGRIAPAAIYAVLSVALCVLAAAGGMAAARAVFPAQ
ncbi:MAG: fluoride efflux transporter CrcB [Pseudomonadota bacterium]